jgi:integrase
LRPRVAKNDRVIFRLIHQTAAELILGHLKNSLHRPIRFLRGDFLGRLAGGSRFVLPGRDTQNKPFAKNALNKALDGLTFDMEPFTIHDQRRTASTLLSENGWTKPVVEKALSHELGGDSRNL